MLSWELFSRKLTLRRWHKWTWEIAYDREKFRWLLVWLWFTLLSIKSLQFSFWFPLLVTFLLLVFICYKRKMQTIAFWHPRYPFIPVGKLLRDRLLRAATSCLLGLQAGEWGASGGISPLSGLSQKLLHSTESLQGPCRKALPDLEVSIVPPGGPLLQLLCRETGERSKSRPCNAGCLVHGEGNGKIKTHAMSCCTRSHVLCRCLQERCKMIWRPPTLFACDLFSKDALHVAAGLGVLKSFSFLVLVTSCFYWICGNWMQH